jgi:UDP-N-acetylmuramate dehydrogenase
MRLGYRYSTFQDSGDIIISADFQLKAGEKSAIAAQMKELMDRRNQKQPVNLPSAGSFFKRPDGYFAGKLIQDSGLKGLSVGGAQVSPLHAGFIVNNGGATATDILRLMKLIQNTVFDKFGVRLEPEVRILGD